MLQWSSALAALQLVVLCKLGWKGSTAGGTSRLHRAEAACLTVRGTLYMLHCSDIET